MVRKRTVGYRRRPPPPPPPPEGREGALGRETFGAGRDCDCALGRDMFCDGMLCGRFIEEDPRLCCPRLLACCVCAALPYPLRALVEGADGRS